MLKIKKYNALRIEFENSKDSMIKMKRYQNRIDRMEKMPCL